MLKVLTTTNANTAKPHTKKEIWADFNQHISFTRLPTEFYRFLFSFFSFWQVILSNSGANQRY